MTAALRLAVQLANHRFFENNKDHSVAEVAKFLQSESAIIEDYLNNVLITGSKRIDFLVMNRYPGEYAEQ